MSLRKISIKSVVRIDVGVELLVEVPGTCVEKIRFITINGKNMEQGDKFKRLVELLKNDIDSALTREIEVVPDDFGPALIEPKIAAPLQEEKMAPKFAAKK